MPSFNKVILMGNLTADPELKQTPSGVAVTSFSIAVERRFQNQVSVTLILSIQSAGAKLPKPFQSISVKVSRFLFAVRFRRVAGPITTVRSAIQPRLSPTRFHSSEEKTIPARVLTRIRLPCPLTVLPSPKARLKKFQLMTSFRSDFQLFAKGGFHHG